MESPQVPDWGEANKPRVMAFLQFLDGELKDRAFIAGAGYSVADITAMVAVDFMRVSKLAVPEALTQSQTLAPGGFGAAERGRVGHPHSEPTPRRRISPLGWKGRRFHWRNYG